MGRREIDKIHKARHHRFFRHMLVPLAVVPTIVALFIASLAFLPAGAFSPGLLNLSSNVTATICPRATICSEGTVQIGLLAIARLSAYGLYVALALAMITKCYCSLHFLRSTIIAQYIPFQWIHNLHSTMGVVAMYLTFLHTAAHLARWAVRDASSATAPIGAMLYHQTGASGLVAVALFIIAIVPMTDLYKKHLAKRLKWTFEARHAMHLLSVPMLLSLSWHHHNIAVFCGVVVSIWALDRSYLVLFKTTRVNDVTFTRLSNGSVQMVWLNPNARPRPGEYVRIMVPMISNEFHPFSTFEYLPQHNAQGSEYLRISSTFSLSDAIRAVRRSSKAMHNTTQASSGCSSSVEEVPSFSRTPNESSRSENELALSSPEEGAIAPAKPTLNDAIERPGLELRPMVRYSQVMIGPFGDWTRSLSEHVRKWSLDSDGNSWTGPCWVQGPFTSPFNLSIGYGRLILVVTGIGITAALPIVQQLHHSGREVFLVWLTPSTENIAFFLPMLFTCTATFIFCDDPNSSAEVDHLRDSLAHLPHVALYAGRPRLEGVIDYITLSQYQKLGRTLAEFAPSSTNKQQQAVVSMMAPSRSLDSSVHGSSLDSSKHGSSILHLPKSVDSLYGFSASLLRKQLSAEDRATWAVLYCGNVTPVRRTLRRVAKDWDFTYSEESFAW